MILALKSVFTVAERLPNACMILLSLVVLAQSHKQDRRELSEAPPAAIEKHEAVPLIDASEKWKVRVSRLLGKCS